MSKIRTNFNNASSNYNENAFLQNEIATRLSEKLKVISINPKTILDLGSGTGFLSEKTAKLFPDADLFCVDFAQQSLTKNSQKLKVCADANQLPFSSNSVDFVISNLMMQWCPKLNTLFDECNRVLKPRGLILFTTFGPETLNELKRSWSVVDNEVHVNEFIDMHDIGDQMIQSGFQSPVMEMEKLTLTYERVVDLMHDLKGIGAQSVENRSKSLTGKTKFKKMIELYENYRENGKIPATYEVIYGHAWKNDIKFGAISLEN
jgi:malonyl-CoA O-methyltransferase